MKGTASSKWWRGRAGAMSNPLSGRLGRRLLVWILALALVPLLVTNTLGYVKSEDLIVRLVERYLEAIASSEAQSVRSEIDRYLLDLQAISAGNEFLVAGALRLTGEEAGPMGEAANREAVERHLEQKWRELVVFDALYLHKSSGEVIASAGVADEVARVPVGSHRVEPRLERAPPGVDGQPRFYLCVPVRSPSGDVVAHLSGLVGGVGLSGLVKIPEHLAGSIETFILDERGHPIFVSHRHGAVYWDEPLETPLLAAPVGAFASYEDRLGVPVIGTSTPVLGLSWRLMTEVPVADALGPLYVLRRLSTIFGTVLAIGVVIMAWLVSGGIVAPVRRLVAATRRVGRGDLTVEVEVEEDDEIGELGHAFNEMTRELADTSARVRELHQREIERAGQLATVGELASGVAHEIKNPVVGISNGLDLVQRRIGADPTLAPIMDEMTRQLSRIEYAVRDLLAFARPATPSLEPGDVNQIAQRARLLVGPAAERAGVRVELALDPGLPAVMVDVELLRQALVNLMMNAVQATAAGDRVTLSTRSVEDGVAVSVSDTGRGIPPDDQGDVFKPFFTTRHNGTGLGLSITREIVERHGGRIELESRVGMGSTFVIVLPAEVAEVVAARVADRLPSTVEAK